MDPRWDVQAATGPLEKQVKARPRPTTLDLDTNMDEEDIIQMVENIIPISCGPPMSRRASCSSGVPLADAPSASEGQGRHGTGWAATAGSSAAAEGSPYCAPPSTSVAQRSAVVKGSGRWTPGSKKGGQGDSSSHHRTSAIPQTMAPLGTPTSAGAVRCDGAPLELLSPMEEELCALEGESTRLWITVDWSFT